MKPENKKIAMYIGGAVVLGAVGFFIYSFFQKPVIVNESTSVNLGESIEEKEPVANTTKSVFAKYQDMQFAPIKVPNVFDKALISSHF
jgi:hypothetical protein